MPQTSSQNFVGSGKRNKRTLQESKMSPDFQIITSRLCLRLINANEAEPLAMLIRTSPSLHQWVDWCHADFTLKEAQQFLLTTRLNWVKADGYGFGIFHRENGQLLGMVAINELYHTYNMVSIGYWIADKYQRQGNAREAITALVEFCFAKLQVSRIEIVCDPENLASQKLIERCHAKRESIARHRFLFHGEPRDGVVYSLIPSDLI